MPIGIPPVKEVDSSVLTLNMCDARARTLELMHGLDDTQIISKKLTPDE